METKKNKKLNFQTKKGQRYVFQDILVEMGNIS